MSFPDSGWRRRVSEKRRMSTSSGASRNMTSIVWPVPRRSASTWCVSSRKSPLRASTTSAARVTSSRTARSSMNFGRSGIGRLSAQ